MPERGAFAEGEPVPAQTFVPASAEARFALLRAWLFLGIGLALPFAAFPLFRISGRWVDLSTLFALLFVAASLPSVPRGWRRLPWRWFLAAATVPLLAVLSPGRRQCSWRRCSRLGFRESSAPGHPSL
jgi:hypothetical protein